MRATTVRDAGKPPQSVARMPDGWIAVGSDRQGTRTFQVWRSKDLERWEEVTELDAGPADYPLSLEAVAANGSEVVAIVAGGYGPSRVWRSSDAGSTWREESVGPAKRNSRIERAVAFGDGIALIEPMLWDSVTDTTSRSVWLPEGNGWRLSVFEAQWARPDGFINPSELVVHGNRLVGLSATDRGTALVSLTEDGRWSVGFPSEPGGFEARDGMLVSVGDRLLWIADDRSSRPDSVQFWISADGTSWQRTGGVGGVDPTRIKGVIDAVVVDTTIVLLAVLDEKRGPQFCYQDQATCNTVRGLVLAGNESFDFHPVGVLGPHEKDSSKWPGRLLAASPLAVFYDGAQPQVLVHQPPGSVDALPRLEVPMSTTSQPPLTMWEADADHEFRLDVSEQRRYGYVPDLFVDAYRVDPACVFPDVNDRTWKIEQTPTPAPPADKLGPYSDTHWGVIELENADRLRFATADGSTWIFTPADNQLRCPSYRPLPSTI